MINLTKLEDIYRKKHIFLCLSLFLELPKKSKKPIISLARLCLNQKLKKEKEILAVKQSLLTPKNFSKVFSFKLSDFASTLEKKSMPCATDRRMKYSCKLKQKKKKEKKSSRKGYEILRFYSPIKILGKSLLSPLLRLFFGVFCIKRNKKVKSFSILTKCPPVSPKLID